MIPEAEEEVGLELHDAARRGRQAILGVNRLRAEESGEYGQRRSDPRSTARATGRPP